MKQKILVDFAIFLLIIIMILPLTCSKQAKKGEEKIKKNYELLDNSMVE